MEVLEARRNDVLVVALKGRLDAVSAPSVRNHLQERIDQGERRFAVDAAGLTYISSCGLGLLLQVAKQLEARSGQIKRIFQIAGFTALFGILSSSEEAIQECKRD